MSSTCDIGERNVIGGITASALSGFIEFLTPMKWFALFAVVLILADLRFGINAAKVRKEKIRLSRAVRRTVNKMIDYSCWILLAAAIDKAMSLPFDMPIIPSLVLLVVYGCELNSCFENYFTSRGLNYRINFFSFFRKKFDIEVEGDGSKIEQRKRKPRARA